MKSKKNDYIKSYFLELMLIRIPTAVIAVRRDGRKPSATEIMNTYKNSKIIKEENDMYQTIVSREDMEKLFQNEDNPEVQEKLRKLMEMKSVLE